MNFATGVQRLAGFVVAIVVATSALPARSEPIRGGGQLEAHALPAAPYVEVRSGAQFVSADIIVRNTGVSALKLAAIRLEVFDGAGKLELEREVNGNGTPPALAALGALVVNPGQTADFYQPFDRFDADVELTKMRFELVFVAADRPIPPVVAAGDVALTVEVAPRRYTPVAYCLPLAGRLLVHDGHDFLSHHRRHNLAASASRSAIAKNPNLYASDFVVIDPAGALYKGDRNKKTNWFTFGLLVSAPTDGLIVRAADGVPDNQLTDDGPMVPAEATRLDPDGFGNYVAIEALDGRVSWLLHLEAGSLRARVGEHVHAGDPIGRIGFSGDALFPHLHFDVTSDREYPSQGVPSYFKNFERLLGDRRLPVTSGQIDTGDIIERKPSCST